MARTCKKTAVLPQLRLSACIRSKKKLRICIYDPQENNFIRNYPQNQRYMVRSSRCPVGGMPPKAHLESHLTAEELKIRYRQAQNTTESRRWHLLLLVSRNWTIKQAAQVVGLNYDYAKEIVQRYNREGPNSVRNRSGDRQPPPAKSLLDPQQQEELRQALQGSAPDGGDWTGPKVARWIAEKIGSDHVWPQRGWDYLKRLGSHWRRRRK